MGISRNWNKKKRKKLEPLYTAGENVKWCSVLAKNIWQFLKNLKHRITIKPNIPSLGVHSRNYIISPPSPKKDTKKCSSHICPNSQKVETIQMFINKNINISIQRNITGHKRKWSTDICYNMDEPWKYDT